MAFLLDTDTTADRCYDQAVASRPPMSEEQLKSFLDAVKADALLQDKLKAAASNEAALQIAKDAGFSITAEDIQSMQSATIDEELGSAAGGHHGGPSRPFPYW